MTDRSRKFVEKSGFLSTLVARSILGSEFGADLIGSRSGRSVNDRIEQLVGPELPNRGFLNLPEIYSKKILNDGGGDILIRPGVYDLPYTDLARATAGTGAVHQGTSFAPLCVVQGPGASYGRNGAVVFRFSGAEVNNASPYQASMTLSAPGCIVKNIIFEPRSLADRPMKGGLIRAHKAGFYNCTASFFADFGLGASAGSGDGSNANEFFIIGGRCARNRRGYVIDIGGELNVGLLSQLDATGNDEWGIVESGFLGNLYLSCHAANNGTYDLYATREKQRRNRLRDLLLQGITLSLAQGLVDLELPALTYVGGNYRIENLANYSTFVACYTEGSQPCLSRSQQITVFGGNLVQQIQLVDSNWTPLRTAGVQRFGWRSYIRHEQDGLLVVTPAIAGTRRAAFLHRYIQDLNTDAREVRQWELQGSGLDEAEAAAQALAELPSTAEDEPHYGFVRWNTATPEWFENTILLDLVQPSGSPWTAPLAITSQKNTRGPGYLGQGRPSYNTPFDFRLWNESSVLASSTSSITFTHSYLTEPALPHHLELSARVLVLTAGAPPRVTWSAVERVNATTVRVHVDNPGVSPVSVRVTLHGKQWR